MSATFIVTSSPPAGVILISASFACFGTSTVKSPLASDVTFFSCPSGVLTVTSVFGFVLPLTVVVVLAGSFSAFPFVTVGFSSTKFVTCILSSEPSGYLITILPLLSNSTVVLSGNLVLLAFLTALITAFFSSSVKLVGFATGVFSGIVGSILSASDFIVMPRSDVLFPLASSA